MISTSNVRASRSTLPKHIAGLQANAADGTQPPMIRTPGVKKLAEPRCFFIIHHMKTQYYAASSLDGFIAAPDHSLDWLLQFGDVEGTSYPSFIRDVGAIVMGSSTYEWIVRNQVRPGTKQEKPWPYDKPAWVFASRTLIALPGADVRFVSGDVRRFHPQMAEAANGKNIRIVGGGDLAGQFYDAGLLDELIIQITSVTLGKGIPLFPREIIHPPLRLLSARAFGEAFAEVRYAVPSEK